MEPKAWPERADWQGNSRFNSLYPFMDLPVTQDLSNADFAIVGLPFDGATLLRPGARYGPSAIRAASSLLAQYSDDPQQRNPPYSQLRVVDYGDAPLIPYHVEETWPEPSKQFRPCWTLTLSPSASVETIR